MKIKSFVVCCLLFSLATARAQTVSVLTQQLSALQEFLRTTQTGYDWVGTGLQWIGQITRGEFRLHTDFFGAMDSVSTAVRSDAGLAGLREGQIALMQQIQSDLAFWRKQRSDQP